jgi:iron(III) transport system substrate-binding protein
MTRGHLARPRAAGASTLALALALHPACHGGPAAVAPAPEALTVYAAQGPEVTDPVLEAFRSKHPGLRVDVIRGGTGEMLGRIRAEQASPQADVLWGGSLDTYAAHADLFAPLDVEQPDDFELADPERRWHPFTANVIHLVVNTERVGDRRPRSFRELLDPAWRALGPVGFANPATSGTGYSVTTALVTALGWDFVAELLGNAWLTDASDSMFKWVKDGETAAGFLFEMTLRDYLEAGARLAPVYAVEGLITQTDGAGLVAGARHPAAAAELLRFLVGPEAQEIASRVVGRRPARRGVAPPRGLASLEGQALIRADPRRAGSERAAVLREFERARERAGR